MCNVRGCGHVSDKTRQFLLPIWEPPGIRIAIAAGETNNGWHEPEGGRAKRPRPCSRCGVSGGGDA